MIFKRTTDYCIMGTNGNASAYTSEFCNSSTRKQTALRLPDVLKRDTQTLVIVISLSKPVASLDERQYRDCLSP